MVVWRYTNIGGIIQDIPGSCFSLVGWNSFLFMSFLIATMLQGFLFLCMWVSFLTFALTS